jgi:hypothetical protein
MLKRELGSKRVNEFPEMLILHTDRGSEYSNKGYLEFLGLLVLTGIVSKVVYSRLPVGHTFVTLL